LRIGNVELRIGNVELRIRNVELRFGMKTQAIYNL
jgi:hypothetical protein